MANKKLVLPPGISTDIKYKSLQERQDYTPDRENTYKSVAMPQISTADTLAARKSLNNSSITKGIEPTTDYRKALNTSPIVDNVGKVDFNPMPNSGVEYWEKGMPRTVLNQNKKTDTNIGKAITDLGASVIKGFVTEAGNFPKATGQMLEGANNLINNSKIARTASTLLPGGIQMAINNGQAINKAVMQPTGDKIRETGQKFDRQSESNSPLWNNTLSTFESLGRMGADIPMSIASGMPTPAIMGLTSADESYNENIANGMKPNEALMRAAVSGAIEGGSEYALGGETVSKVIKGQWKELLAKTGKEAAEEAMKKTLGHRAWDFVKKEILAEAGQEAGTEVLHDAADTVLNGAYNGQWNDGRTLGQDVTNALWAGYGGGLMGAVGGGASTAVKTIVNAPGLGTAEVIGKTDTTTIIQTETGEQAEVRDIFLQNADVQEVPTQLAESQDQAAAEVDTPKLSDDERINQAISEIDAIKADHEAGKVETKDYLAKLAEIDSRLYDDASKTNVEPLQATESKPNIIASETKNKSITEALLNEDGQTTLNKIKADMKTQGIDADFKVIKGGTKFHEDIRRITKSLGVQVVFYKGDKVPNGFISNSVKNTIFIHSSGEKNDMVATTGHEFLHHVKKTYAKEYGELLNFAKTYFSEEARQQFLDTYSNAPELQKQLSADENGLLEEMLADEMGNNFMDKNFWQKVYEHSKELFEKLVEVAQKIVANFSNEDKYETYVGKETAETLSKKFEEAVASVRKQVAEGKVDTEAKIEKGEGVQLSDNKYWARGAETKQKLDPFDAEKLENHKMSLDEAVKKGLIDSESVAVIKGMLDSFPHGWQDHIGVVFSDQEFSMGAERKGTAYNSTDRMTSTTVYEKIGNLKNDAKHIMVLFKDSNVLDFIHQYGDFLYNRVLTTKDKKVITQSMIDEGYYKVTPKGKKEVKYYKNAYFGEMLEKWWLNGEDITDSQETNKLFFNTVQSIKNIKNRFFSLGKVDAIGENLKALMDDIIGTGTEYVQKMEYRYKKMATDQFFMDEEVLFNYYIATPFTTKVKDINKIKKEERWKIQGISNNAKTGLTYDPSTNCPKKEDFMKYVLSRFKKDNLPLVELLKPEYYEELYDDALREGITVPCSYCYVEATRRAAIFQHLKGAKKGGVRMTGAKELYSNKPYYNELKKMSNEDKFFVMQRGGFRIFSFSDYVREQHFDDISRFLRDAMEENIPIKVITKQLTFVHDFAHMGFNIQLSVDTDGYNFGGFDYTTNERLNIPMVSQGITWHYENGAIRKEKSEEIKKVDSEIKGVKYHDEFHDAFWYASEYPNVVVRSIAKNIDEALELVDLVNPYNNKQAISVITPFHGVAKGLYGYEDMAAGTPKWKKMMAAFAAKEQADNVIDGTYKSLLCCAEGGKCFNKDNNKQCATNCGIKAGFLTMVNADADKSNRKTNLFKNISIDGIEVVSVDNIVSPTSEEAITTNIENSGLEIEKDAKKNDTQFSIRSKEFKQWFGDSKVVDSKGNPLKVFHGTDSKFTVFHEWTPNFFTTAKDYAEGYGKKIMQVYLSIQKPFNTENNEEARKIYNEDFIPYAKEKFKQETGRFNLLKSGEKLPFTTADYLYVFLRRKKRENKLDYDGIIVDEAIGDGGWKTSYVPLYPTQIKSATGNNGEYASDNPDIRESVRQKERSHHQRYEEADITAPELLEKLTEESKKYEPISIKDTWDEAYDEVKGDIKGYRKQIDQMTEFRTAKDVATAEAVLYITQNEAKELKNSGEKALANDMFELSARIGEKIDAHFTKAGQVVSMGRLWKALGTEATIKFIRKKVNNQRTDKENERLKTMVKELQAEIERLLESSKTEEEAKEKVKEAIKKALDFKTGMFAAGELTEEQRGWVERLTEMALEGDLTGDELSQFFAARWKIPIFSGLMAARVMELSEAIDGLEKGTDEYNIAVNRLNDYMNAIIKHDIWEHVNTVENLAMLSGTKSMSRNVIGNVGRLVAYDAEKFGMALLDIGRTKFTKDHKRTVMMPSIGKQLKAGGKAIIKDLKDFRYDTNSRSVEDGREFGKYIKYSNKPMNIFQRWVKLIMSDRPFTDAMVAEVVSEAENLAKKNGIKFDAAEARQIAEEVANETFFNGDDDLINAVLKFRKSINAAIPNLVHRKLLKNKDYSASGAWGVGSIVLKFAKVPYNISKFAIEREWHLAALKIFFRSVSTGYGAFKNTDLGYWQNEKFDSKEFIKDVTKGLNGAFIMYLGSKLFELGIINIRPDDDDKDKKLLGLEKLIGTNKYQLNLSAFRRILIEESQDFKVNGFKSFVNNSGKQELQENDMLATLDWFTPLSILMVAGIKSQQVYEERTKQPGNRELEWYQKLAEQLFSAAPGLTEGIIEQVNTVLEMPMLQSLNKFKYADSLPDGLLEILKDIPARFVPAPVKYAKEAVDNTQREVYSPIPLGDVVNKVRVKLPGISKDVQPKIGMLGDELELYQNAKNNFLNIALNPAIVTRYKTIHETKKMLDVYQKYGIKDQIPTPVQKSFVAKKIDYPSLTKDETIILTAKEYTYYQQEFGKEVKKLLGGFTVYEKDKEYQQKEANKLNAQYTKAKQDIQAKIIKERGIK